VAGSGLAPVLAGGPEVVGRNIGVMKGTGEGGGERIIRARLGAMHSLSLCDEITLSSIAWLNR
jgi:hypothetical protein